MALKVKLTADEFNKLDDSHKALYVDKGDGSYALDVEGIEDTANLKSALEKTRKELRDVHAAMDKFKDVDPEKYQQLLQQQADLQIREKEQKGEWESAKAQMLERHKVELEGERAKTASWQKKFETEHAERRQELIDRESLTAISDAKGNRILLLPQIRQHVRIIEEEGKTPTIQVLNPAGEPWVDGKGQPMTIRGMLEEWKNKDEYAGAFAGNGASGGGGSAGSRMGVTAGVITLTEDQAKDPQTYRAARDRAAKEGLQLRVQSAPAQ